MLPYIVVHLLKYCWHYTFQFYESTMGNGSECISKPLLRSKLDRNFFNDGVYVFLGIENTVCKRKTTLTLDLKALFNFG